MANLALPAPRAAAAPLLAAALAIAAAAALLWAVSLLLPSAPPPARSPFGVGVTEATGAGGIAGWAIALQAEYGRRIAQAVAGLRTEGGAAWLAGLSFLYGVLHAAGPGHGKAVISAYILATGADLRRGIAASLGAALVQGLVAMLLVAVLSLALSVGPDDFRAVAGRVETAGFLVMAGFGAWLLWHKSAALSGSAAHACGPGCGHAGPGAGIAAALAGGLRPCSGAILVLVLASSQGMYLAGAACVLLMSLGTALTTSLVAALGVYAKSLALRLGGGRPGPGATVLLAAEAVVAAATLLLGLLLALGAAGAAGGALSG